MHTHFELGCTIAELMNYGKVSIDTPRADGLCPHCIGEMIANHDNSLFEFEGELYVVVFKFEPFEVDEAEEEDEEDDDDVDK